MLSINNITSKISKGADRVMGKLVNRLPNMTVSGKRTLKCIKWAGEHISSPQNRLILGASALLSQPYIDLHNKRVDEETRKASAARTVAKILAGTTSGFLVRYYSIKAMDSLAKMPAKNRKAWETFLTPLPEYIQNVTKSMKFSKAVKLTKVFLGQYKKTIGTIIALWIMVGTNFLFDAPVTKMLTNKFIAMNKNIADKKRRDKTLTIDQFSYPLNNYVKHNSPTNLIDIAVRKKEIVLSSDKGVHDA